LNWANPKQGGNIVAYMGLMGRHYSYSSLTRHLLDLFGHASGLRTNLAKSSVSPIHCTDEELALIANVL